MKTDHVMPVPDDAGDEIDHILTAWISGEFKPVHEGAYVRAFDEGEGLSWWYESRWNMDSFFAGPSDIQNASWRGIDKAFNPTTAALQEKGNG